MLFSCRLKCPAAQASASRQGARIDLLLSRDLWGRIPPLRICDWPAHQQLACHGGAAPPPGPQPPSLTFLSMSPICGDAPPLLPLALPACSGALPLQLAHGLTMRRRGVDACSWGPPTWRAPARAPADAPGLCKACARRGAASSGRQVAEGHAGRLASTWMQGAAAMLRVWRCQPAAPWTGQAVTCRATGDTGDGGKGWERCRQVGNQGGLSQCPTSNLAWQRLPAQ